MDPTQENDLRLSAAEALEDAARLLHTGRWTKGALSHRDVHGKAVAWCARGAIQEIRKLVLGHYVMDFRDPIGTAADQAFAEYIERHDLLGGRKPAYVCNGKSNAGVTFNNEVAKDKYEVIDVMMATAKELRNA